MDAFGAGRPSFGRYVVYGKRIRTAGSTKSLEPAACREFVDSGGINLIPFERNRVNVPHRYNSGSTIKRPLVAALLAIAMASAAGAQGRHPVFDPISQDEIVADTAFPPRVAEVSFESDGVKLYGLVLSAQGKGLHPTVLYARGFPDTTGNNDILRVMQRAGYNVMFFNYRGTSSMGGVFSMQHSYEDLRAALSFLRQENSAKTMGVDPANVILYGYSWGGPIALRLAAEDPAVRDLILQDPTDLRTYSSMTPQALAEEEADGTSPVVPTTTAKQVIDGIVAHASDWDPVHYVGGLSGKNVLVAWASSKSSNQVAPADSLATLLGPRAQFTSAIFNTDHGFTDKRIALTRKYLGWLRSIAPARTRPLQPH